MLKCLTLALCLPLLLAACHGKPQAIDPEAGLDYCTEKILEALPSLTDSLKIPRNIPSAETQWSCVAPDDWTSGYFPGILWYVYEYRADTAVRRAAERFTLLQSALADKIGNHDLGIMAYASMANAYELTGNNTYKNALLRAAAKLSQLYNPTVGTLHSWPYMVQTKGWPHNTIIDNMINIELLFWAAANGGSPDYYDIACNHARTTLKNHFRPDHSTYHVVIYDTLSGDAIQHITHQGYSDSSTWARGQAWAVYGYTMCTRYTRDGQFLKAACDAADLFLSKVGDDMVPYWDFDDPAIPDAPRDASAAAIAASALVELSGMCDAPREARYMDAAVKILEALGSAPYKSGDANSAFLSHCVGHMPHGSEVDASIVYADYYYIEALTRLHRISGN